jgi:hypothetical protein
MADSLNQDVESLRAWLRGAWLYLADHSLTSFDRREIRNYMKDAEIALGAGLRRIAERERVRREQERVALGTRRPDFRILKLDT